MSFVDALNQYNVKVPSAEESYEMMVQSQPTPTPTNPNTYQWEWQKEYDAIRSAANAALGGLVSPYEGSGWGGNPLIMNNLEKLFMDAAESKLDPMRMFTSETTQLRTIGTDQAKILRLFEARLKESLSEKGKHGLNEMDIEGLQALTAGKNILISSVKEQVAIQAKKAELKIKQQQAMGQGGGGISGRATSQGISSGSPYSEGRSIIDNIFSMNIPAPVSENIPATVGDATPESAAAFIDDLVVTNDIKNEAAGYEVKVIIDGDDDSSARFAVVDNAGNEVDLPGQSLPDSSKITINRDINTAYGEGSVPYGIIRKY